MLETKHGIPKQKTSVDTTKGPPQSPKISWTLVHKWLKVFLHFYLPM